jgi:CheY-like chemotaxis protein
LLVEDEVAVRVITSEWLRDLGYHMLEAEDGPTALGMLNSTNHLDLLVTDVGLPNGLNGRQVADAARERRPGLPVLFITGYAGSVLENQLEPGMQVIRKPFALDELAARIAAMLEQRVDVPAG